MSRRIGVIGVPPSAGAFARTGECAAGAARGGGWWSGFTTAGSRCGTTVIASGGGGGRIARTRAQNLDKVVEIVGDTARRVAEAAGSGELTLVLGGDCTLGAGTVAGHSADRQPPGVIYFDAHADLDVPASVRPGTLDWTGMAHMLGEGGRPCGARAGGGPLLEPDQVVPLGWTRCSQRHANARRSCGYG